MIRQLVVVLIAATTTHAEETTWTTTLPLAVHAEPPYSYPLDAADGQREWHFDVFALADGGVFYRVPGCEPDASLEKAVAAFVRLLNKKPKPGDGEPINGVVIRLVGFRDEASAKTAVGRLFGAFTGNPHIYPTRELVWDVAGWKEWDFHHSSSTPAHREAAPTPAKP